MVNQSLVSQLNEMERAYFYQRRTGEASGTGYIGGNTWRGWRASPKIEGAVKDALVAAFDFLVERFERFLRETSSVDRSKFDAFHEIEIEALFKFFQSHHKATVVHPAAGGDYNGHAYNSYAKVLNLAYTHWCFRPQPRSKKIQYDPVQHPGLLRCLHLPLDTNVHICVNELRLNGTLPPSSVRIPNGGMGAIRSRDHYMQVQSYLRSVVDHVPSMNFPGNMVSPLAFEACWGM